jgi:hypothetical protein
MARLAPTRSVATLGVALVALAIVAVIGANLAAAQPAPSPGSSTVVVVITPSPITTEPPSPAPSDTPVPSDSALPSDSPSPSPTASPPPAKGPLVATRVVVPALGIDLAVTKSPPVGVYPYCNVAMYFGKPLGQPGQNRATYLFAHARDGMFGPIYKLAMVQRTPGKMVGMTVDVYTSDSMLHVYKITRVLLHQLTLNAAVAVHHDELWLQTSEGPHGTPGKTQVVAEPVSVSAADYAAAHPKVHIVRCGF